jgi:glucosylceramidase
VLGVGQVTGPIGKCLDVFYGRAANGTPADLLRCNGTAAQRWTRRSTGSLEALGKCLDFEQPHGNAPQRAVLWSCDGTPSQRWVAAGGLLVNRANNKCLEIAPGETADFSPAQIGVCTGEANQRWHLPS